MTYLNKQTKQVGLQIGLAAVCINEWKVMFDVRVSVKPERNIVKFLKYFINISWNILWNISGEKFHEILHHYFYLWQKVKFVTCSRELQIYNGKHCRSVASQNSTSGIYVHSMVRWRCQPNWSTWNYLHVQAEETITNRSCINLQHTLLNIISKAQSVQTRAF